MANVRVGKRWRSRQKRRERAREPCAWRSRVRRARECAPSSLAAVRVRFAPVSVRRNPPLSDTRAGVDDVPVGGRAGRNGVRLVAARARDHRRRTRLRVRTLQKNVVYTRTNGRCTGSVTRASPRDAHATSARLVSSLADHASERPLLHHGRALVTGREALVQRERRREHASRARVVARRVAAPTAS